MNKRNGNGKRTVKDLAPRRMQHVKGGMLVSSYQHAGSGSAGEI